MTAMTTATRLVTGSLLSAFPMMRGVPLRLRQSVYHRIFYSRAHDFAYFRIPKCANSTVVMTLHSAMAAQRHSAALSDQGRAGSREAKESTKRDTLGYLLNDLRGRRSFAFTVVRNPLSRTLSCYLDKIASPKLKFRQRLGLDDRSLSLLDFLHRLDDGYLLADPHWAPQSHLAPFESLDFVGRVENLAHDLDAVMTRLFPMASFPVVTKTTGQTNSIAKLDEYCGRAERTMMAKLYARDFEHFYPDAL
jgi:hypothetical protein